VQGTRGQFSPPFFLKGTKMKEGEGSGVWVSLIESGWRTVRFWIQGSTLKPERKATTERQAFLIVVSSSLPHHPLLAAVPLSLKNAFC
jgi:hypothetical protein